MVRAYLQMAAGPSSGPGTVGHSELFSDPSVGRRSFQFRKTWHEIVLRSHQEKGQSRISAMRRVHRLVKRVGCTTFGIGDRYDLS